MLSQHFLFFFAMLGAFNGLALACHLAWRSAGKPAQRWLSFLVLMISLRTGKSVVFFFWPDIPKIVLQIGLTACFMIGPSLFFLIRSSQGETASLSRVDRWHLASVLGFAAAMNVFYPYASHAGHWAFGAYHVWLAYLMLSTGLLYQHRGRLSGSPAMPMLLGVTAGVWVIWLAYYTAGYTSYIVGALSFSFVLVLSVLVYLRIRAGQAPIEPYQDRRIPEGEAAAQLQALADLMARERLHLDPALTLPRVARRLGIPQARLTQLLNDNNQTTFKQYLTQMRVGEAKALLRQDAAKPIELIAEAAGFQSMSTFYSAFKKVEGVTPAAYRQRATGS